MNITTQYAAPAAFSLSSANSASAANATRFAPQVSLNSQDTASLSRKPNLQRQGECILGSLASCACCCALLPALAIGALVVGTVVRAARAARTAAV
jgi:hypothetical protein